MLTLDALKEYGANIEEGMGRCLNNEAIYLRLVNQAMGTTNLEDLKTALDENDLNRAFELCHAMKGVFGNLALSPLYELSSEMTEHLRHQEQADYAGLYARLSERADALKALCDP